MSPEAGRPAGGDKIGMGTAHCEGIGIVYSPEGV